MTKVRDKYLSLVCDNGFAIFPRNVRWGPPGMTSPPTAPRPYAVIQRIAAGRCRSPRVHTRPLWTTGPAGALSRTPAHGIKAVKGFRILHQDAVAQFLVRRPALHNIHHQHRV